MGAKGIAILILVVLASSILATVFLAAAVYFDDLDTKAKAATAKETAIGNEALNTILTMEDGKYRIKYKGKNGEEVTGKKALEEILEDNNMNFEDFNNEELECLYKCLKAEWATTYPNLGKNVDNADANGEYVQGVITIKRGKSDGSIIDLEYKPYEEFSNIKDENALKYFSMKDGKLIVANWSSTETKYEIEGDMPDDIKEQYKNTGEQINITETSINYRSMIGVHALPYELVLSLLVNTEDVDCVNDLADLAFDSTIELTVYDNTKVITTTYKEHTHEKTTYEKWANYYIKRINKEILADGKTIGHYTEHIGNEEETKVKSETNEIDYTLTTTTITRDNSYVLGLTNVSSWLGNVKNVYTHQNIMGSEENSELGEPQTYSEKKEEEININDSDIVGFINSKHSEETKIDSWNNSTNKTEEVCIATKARKKELKEGLYEITENKLKTDEYKYEEGTKTIENIGIKFKELYDKYLKTRAQLECVSSWLFEMLEDTESTVDYVSIMKYLLYVCTDVNYGVTEENLNDILDVMEIRNANSGLVVKTDITGSLKVLSKEEIKKVIEDNYEKEAKENLLSALDGIYEGQQKYKVNALFTIAVTEIESECGTKWVLIDENTYNWASIKGSYKGNSYKDRNGTNWKKYSSFGEAAIDFADLIATSSYYFKAGNYTPALIGPIYCNYTWGENCEKTILRLCEKSGIEVNIASESTNSDGTKTINNGDYVEVSNGSSFAEFGRNNGFYQGANKSKWGDSCLGFSIVYATAIKNNNKQLILTNKASLKGNSPVGTSWPKELSDSSQQKVLKNVYDEINKGNPCIIQVNGNKNGTSRHYVVVIGYKKSVTSRELIKDTDLLIIDVWDAKVEPVGKKGSGNRFMIKGTDTTSGYNYGYQMYKF